MSANPSARSKLTRRSLFAAGTAAAAIGAPALARSKPSLDLPDPVFVLIEAERVAWAKWDRAIDTLAAAEEAFYASGFNRQARVQTGTRTTIVDAYGDTLPTSEWKETPVYAYSRDEIRAAYTSVTEPIDMQVGTDRRIRMETVNTGALDRALAAFDADRAAIRNCPERKAARAADEIRDWEQGEAESALQAVCGATPTTPAGLLAMLDLFMTRERDGLSSPHDVMLDGIFAAVRSVVTREG